MNRAEISKNIRTAMLGSGIKNKTFATKLGVSETYVRQIQTCQYCPSLWIAKGIAGLIGITLDELVGIKPKRRSWPERTGRISEHMQWVRQDRGVSKLDLEAWSNVSARCISYLECDEREPGIATIVALAEALEMSPGEYIGDPPPTKRGR